MGRGTISKQAANRPVLQAPFASCQDGTQEGDPFPHVSSFPALLLRGLRVIGKEADGESPATADEMLVNGGLWLAGPQDKHQAKGAVPVTFGPMLWFIVSISLSANSSRNQAEHRVLGPEDIG